MLPLKQGSYFNNGSKRQYWNILYCLVFHCENSVFLHTWVPVAKMLPTQQDWLLNKRFQSAVCSICLLLQSVMCWAWQLEEGQEPHLSTLMCASSSDREQKSLGLPGARRWAEVMERAGRSSQFWFVTGPGRIWEHSAEVCVHRVPGPVLLSIVMPYWVLV